MYNWRWPVKKLLKDFDQPSAANWKLIQTGPDQASDLQLRRLYEAFLFCSGYYSDH